MANTTRATIITQIDEAEENVGKCKQRIENLEQNLRNRKYNEEQKDEAKKELDDVKETLSRQEEALKKLRGENRKSLVMAVILLLGIYVVYNFIMFVFKKSQ